ncbi:MAG: hypothetical protein M4579_006391 [Chaenotheca gracillima]|nr:MAG: hypothetical protein M4579_006391 [Chaenotheca gracillima]
MAEPSEPGESISASVMDVSRPPTSTHQDDQSPVDTSYDAYSSSSAWRSYDAPAELEKLPEDTPWEITQVTQLALKRFRQAKTLSESEGVSTNSQTASETIWPPADGTEASEWHSEDSVPVITFHDAESRPSWGLTSNVSNTLLVQSDPEQDHQEIQDVNLAEPRLSFASSATTDPPPSEAQISTRTTSVSSQSSQRSATRRSSNTPTQNAKSRRREPPAMVMGPLGYTTFYGPLKTKHINEPPKVPRSVAIKKFFKERNQTRFAAQYLRLHHLTDLLVQ